MSWLLPITGYSFFDVWTMAHLGFWIFVGSTMWGLKVNRWVALASCLLIALGWEFFEAFVAFRIWPQHWLDPESWWNAWVSDPLTCLVGVWGMYWALDHRRRSR